MCHHIMDNLETLVISGLKFGQMEVGSWEKGRGAIFHPVQMQGGVNIHKLHLEQRGKFLWGVNFCFPVR